jgi:hypothetical protein
VEEGLSRLRQVYPAAQFSNGFVHGRAGMEWVAA